MGEIMKDKSKILYERALITCLIMLFICIIFKLFGFNYFNLNTDIPILKEIDNVVMNSVPLSFLYSWIFMFLNFYLVTIIYAKRHKDGLLIHSTLCWSLACLSLKYIMARSNTYILFLIDIICLFMSCYMSTDRKLNKDDTKEFLLIVLVNFVYQYISLFIKSVGCNVGYYDLVNGILMNLDYYILLTLTYLYLKKGEFNLCQIFHQSFSSLLKGHLKKRSENYSNKGGK